jgi:hypothetical protein
VTPLKGCDAAVTKAKPTRPSRPEDPATQRLQRKARLLRGDMLPAGAALVTQAEDGREDSETETALQRATGKEERESS